MNIKKTNVFTGNINSIKNIYIIVNHLELMGRNYVCFTPEKPKDSNTEYLYLQSFLDNTKTYQNLEHLKTMIRKPANLFKIDLVVIDIWNFHIIEPRILEIIKILKCDLILITKHPIILKSYKEIEFNNFYQLSGKFDSLVIEDMNTLSKVKFSSLIKLDIRNYKIDDLLD